MVLFSLLWSLVAVADDCASLTQQIKDGSPHEAAPLYVQYSQCDPSGAASMAAEVLPRLLGGDAGHEAVVSAIRVGAGDQALSWVKNLMSDERAPAVRAIGKACKDDETVQQFFTDTASSLGEDFWAQRWYRGLADCRVASIQDILSKRVDEGVGEDRSQYFSVVQAWASNVAATAVPKLAEMIGATDELEIQINLVQAFSDAAQVGSLAGTDNKVADAAASTIVGLAAALPSPAIEQGRITLQSLGHEQEADALAKVRYNALLQKDDSLLYGVVVVETATCKNGKTSQRVHVAEAIDPGQTWPDQLVDKLTVSVQHAWDLNLAERCKGEGKTDVKVPGEPFADKAAFRKWVDEQIKAATHADVKKPVRVDQDDIEL